MHHGNMKMCVGVQTIRTEIAQTRDTKGDEQLLILQEAVCMGCSKAGLKGWDIQTEQRSMANAFRI